MSNKPQKCCKHPSKRSSGEHLSVSNRKIIGLLTTNKMLAASKKERRENTSKRAETMLATIKQTNNRFQGIWVMVWSRMSWHKKPRVTQLLATKFPTFFSSMMSTKKSNLQRPARVNEPSETWWPLTELKESFRENFNYHFIHFQHSFRWTLRRRQPTDDRNILRSLTKQTNHSVTVVACRCLG